MDTYYTAIKLIFRAYQRIFPQESRISGELPVQLGPKIIAANHANSTDAFYLPFVFKEKLHVFVQADLFRLPFFGWILARSQQIPVKRDARGAALDMASRLLEAGKTVMIFPEGRLNPDRRPVKLGTGAIRLALHTGLPILPLGIFVPGEYLRSWSIKKRKEARTARGLWQTCGRCYIRIGSPWFPSLDVAGRSDEGAVSDLTAYLMEMIDTLVRQAALEFAAETGSSRPLNIEEIFGGEKAGTFS